MSQMELNFDARFPLPQPELQPVPPLPAQSPHTLPEWARMRVLREKAAELLRSVGCEAMANQVQVRWNPRMRSTAGTANHRQCLVTMNPALIAFGEVEVHNTLRHELAHLVAHYRAGRRKIAPHGPEWREACADLGIEGEERCHTLPLPRRQVARRYRYKCGGCGIELARVKPLKRPTACLACCRKHSGGKYDERFRFVKICATFPATG